MIKLSDGHKIKTHEELQITFAEWGALMGLAVMLHDGMIPMHSYDNTPSGVHAFNLETSCAANGHCGSVGCIGGYVGLALGKDIEHASNYVHTNRMLHDLYFPTTASLNYARVTPKEAAKVICNVLEYGEPRWREIALKAEQARPRYTPYKGKVLSHNKLNITFAEWLSLICVRVMLEAEAIQFVPMIGTVPAALTFLGRADNEGKHVFNMGNAMSKKHCGSVGCIGGYMADMMGKDGQGYVRDCKYYSNSPLGDLFYPPAHRDWQTIDTRKAVQAIDNFLTTGKPNWEQVLAK